MTADQDPSQQAARLERVLAKYLHSVEVGEPLDRAELIDQHPDLADDLGSFFRNRDAMQQLAEPVRDQAPTIGLTIEENDGSGNRVRYFGDYELVEEINRGGMGVVYRARQVSLNRPVAIKMILSGELASEDDVRRFRLEAEAAANLDHPGILPIYEIGEHEGQHYFSMKLIEGRSLREVMPSFASDVRRGVKLLSEVARAVHHAHQRGVLHRDLKPGNILIDGEGEPHVTDFGLAKRVEGDSDLTKSDAILGTPSYMAPEQATGEKLLSTAVDVYSLGAILYELLVGRAPFRGDSPVETLLAVMTREPERPRAVNSAIDRDLETIVLKCLEKEPQRRYGSAEAMADELDRWLNHEPIEARPVGIAGKLARWSRRNPKLAVTYAAAASIVLLLTAGSYINLRSEQADLLDQYRQSSAWRRSAEVQSEIGKDALARAKYEQAQAVLMSDRPGRRQESLDLLAESNRLRTREIDIFLEQRAEISRTFPRRLIMTTLSTFKKRRDEIDADLNKFLDHWRPLPLASSADHQVWSNPYAETIAADEDAAPITIPSAVDLRNEAVAALLTQDAHVVLQMTTMPGFGASGGFSADGRIAVTPWMEAKQPSDFANPNKLPKGGIRVLDTVEGREIGRTNNLALLGMQPGCVSPDGKRLVVAERIWSLPDGKHLGTLEMPKGADGKPLKKMYRMAFRPDGKELAAFCAVNPHQQHQVHLVVWSPPKPEPRVLMTYQASASIMNRTLEYSADGQQLLVSVGEKKLAFINPHNGDSIKQFDLERTIMGPATLSPDGKSIHVYVSGAKPGDLVVPGRADVQSVLWDVASNRQRHRLLAINGVAAVPNAAAFSPDGRTIVIIDGNDGIAFFEVQTGRQTWRIAAAQHGMQRIVWSPDGKQLITEGIDGLLRRWELSPATPVETIGSGISGQLMAFSPDGNWLAVTTSLVGKGATTNLVNLNTGKVERELPPGMPAFSPDGKRIGFQRFYPKIILQSFDVADGKEIAKFERPVAQNDLVNLASPGFTEDGRLIALRHLKTEPKGLHIWDIAADRSIATIDDGAKTSAGAYFAGGGRTILRMLADKPMRVQAWDWVDGREVLSVALPQDAVGSHMRISPDRRTILVAAMILDMSGARHLGVPAPNNLAGARNVALLQRADAPDDPIELPVSAFVTSIAISPDSKLAATFERGGTLKLFETATGDLVLRCHLPVDADAQIEFTADGTGLAFAEANAPLRTLRLDSLRRELAALGLDW